MKRAIAIASLAVGAGLATTAWADSPNIKGSYAFTGTAACLVAPGPGGNGADPINRGFRTTQPGQFQPKDGLDSFSRSFSVEGIRTFDGNGNGTVSGTAVNITVRPTPSTNQFPPSASSANFSFNFTYTVNGDGSWTATMVPGSFQETIVTGPRAGQTVTVDAIPPISGIISNDGKTLIAAHLEPAVETRTFSNGDVQPEICHRSRVLIKIKDSDDDNGHGN